MRIQPEIYGVDGPKGVVMFIGPTHSASSERIIQTPERHRYLFLFVVFERRPVDTVDTGEPRLYVSSEVTQVGQRPVLGIFDEDGNRILQDEEGDWSDFAAFTKRALELANARLGICMVEFEHEEWRYGSVSGTSEEDLRDRILQGWSVVNSSVGSDGNRWFLLKRPKASTPPKSAQHRSGRMRRPAGQRT